MCEVRLQRFSIVKEANSIEKADNDPERVVGGFRCQISWTRTVGVLGLVKHKYQRLAKL